MHGWAPRRDCIREHADLRMSYLLSWVSTKSDERSGLWVIRVPAESGSYGAPVGDGGRLAHMNYSCVELRVVGSEHGGLPPMRGPGTARWKLAARSGSPGKSSIMAHGDRTLHVVVSCKGRRLCGSVAGSA